MRDHHIVPLDTTVTVDPSSFAGQLRLQASEDWDASVHHRFINELFAGTVSDKVLAKYLIQDYQFFDAFVAMVGAAVATTDSTAARLRFSQQLGMLATDEDDYFHQSFRTLGVKADDAVSAELTQPTVEFVEQMWEVADSRSYPDLLVVLVIAEWLYLDWSERDLPLPSAPKHRGWIDLHRGDDFREWTQFLIDELNRAAPESGSQAGEALAARWQTVVRIERDFFDEAYL